MEHAGNPQAGTRVATWLELAVAPEWRRQQCAVRIHAMGTEHSGCYALSMDGRWICSGDGRLTVFRGFDAALRFLRALRVEEVERGAALTDDVACDGRHYCLCVGRDDCLAQCADGCRRKKLDS